SVVEGQDWPGFRGPARDGRIGGVKIDADRPPAEPLWKHRVGPGWGSFAVVGKSSGSPDDEMRLITQEQRGPDEAGVCYAAAAGRGPVAYRADTGQCGWAAGKASHSYSSPHRATLGGIEQVLMVSDYGVESFAPADGKPLWEHAWQAKGLNRVTQPTVLGDTD